MWLWFRQLCVKNDELTPASNSQDSARGFGKYLEEAWALNPRCSQKSRLCRYACEDDLQEPYREIMRRPKFQGFI